MAPLGLHCQVCYSLPEFINGSLRCRHCMPQGHGMPGLVGPSYEDTMRQFITPMFGGQLMTPTLGGAHPRQAAGAFVGPSFYDEYPELSMPELQPATRLGAHPRQTAGAFVRPFASEFQDLFTPAREPATGAGTSDDDEMPELVGPSPGAGTSDDDTMPELDPSPGAGASHHHQTSEYFREERARLEARVRDEVRVQQELLRRAQRESQARQSLYEVQFAEFEALCRHINADVVQNREYWEDLKKQKVEEQAEEEERELNMP